jgi:hypothetical protein
MWQSRANPADFPASGQPVEDIRFNGLATLCKENLTVNSDFPMMKASHH